MPRRTRIATREFLVFNQELATLLKAGMPLVQSLDILRRRVINPLFKNVLDDVHERVRAGSALSDAFEAHGTLFPGIYTASLLAGEKSGSLEQVLRRYVAYVKVVAAVKRKTVSALVYPAILLALSVVVVSIIVLRVVPAFGEFYAQFGAPAAAGDADHRGGLGFRGGLLPVAGGGGRGGGGVVLDLAEAAGQPAAVRPLGAADADARGHRAQVLDLADGADAGDAARRRHPAGERDRHRRCVRSSNQFMAHELELAAQHVREGRALAAALTRSGIFPDVAVKMVEVGESDRRAAGHAQQPGRLL